MRSLLCKNVIYHKVLVGDVLGLTSRLDASRAISGPPRALSVSGAFKGPESDQQRIALVAGTPGCGCGFDVTAKSKSRRLVLVAAGRCGQCGRDAGFGFRRFVRGLPARPGYEPSHSCSKAPLHDLSLRRRGRDAASWP